MMIHSYDVYFYSQGKQVGSCSWDDTYKHQDNDILMNRIKHYVERNIKERNADKVYIHYLNNQQVEDEITLIFVR
ncbi:hypothetical protein [Sutcliffiella horikoshii]|uniref:hypothetical protein n=1 Tax=Sutcliffiella horikoshii TaxID=79883 RepID=UPI003CEFB4DA